MKISRVEVDLVKIPARTPPFLWRAGLPGSEPELSAAYCASSATTTWRAWPTADAA